LKDDASKMAAVGTIRRSMKLSWFSDGGWTRHVTVRSVAANYRGGGLDGTGLRRAVW